MCTCITQATTPLKHNAGAADVPAPGREGPALQGQRPGWRCAPCTATQPSSCVLSPSRPAPPARLVQLEVEGVVKGLGCGEHVGEEVGEQGEQLVQVVLQRRARQQQRLLTPAGHVQGASRGSGPGLGALQRAGAGPPWLPARPGCQRSPDVAHCVCQQRLLVLDAMALAGEVGRRAEETTG